ncbi:IniB N-terminal domain-containing protein [Microbacterium yannicii]|uniref:IniB N-terminal domain-containing protein n=1 Tax=Microbacterium yannicii TaxID=671622 RepID=UPI0002D7783E|nr:IniB N-terminal domain-containing protein [Microbacterium yannicii]
MTTPLATIADALIEFILSLLNDPAAAEEFDEDPQGTLARNGLGDACVEDVRAVAPVIVDRPDVHHKPHGGHNPTPPGPPSVEKEITNITNSFSIDNRATIVDQSVNQNIWADGDVNQIFDQEAIVNSGDNGAAAGEDAEVDNSDTDTTVGDVAIGNEDTTTNINDSFDDESTNTETEVEVDAEESFNDDSTDVAVDVEVDDSFNDTTEVAVENNVSTEVEATNEGNYYSDDSAVVEDIYVEPETEEQM